MNVRVKNGLYLVALRLRRQMWSLSSIDEIEYYIMVYWRSKQDLENRNYDYTHFRIPSLFSNVNIYIRG